MWQCACRVRLRLLVCGADDLWEHVPQIHEFVGLHPVPDKCAEGRLIIVLWAGHGQLFICHDGAIRRFAAQAATALRLRALAGDDDLCSAARRVCGVRIVGEHTG